MQPDSPAAPLHDDALSDRGLSRVRLLLGLLTLLACYAAGGPGMDSPFILGDEHIFIVNNPDVTGAGRPEHPLQRIFSIFTHVHDDLYQPLPIASYAVEWLAWPGNPSQKAAFIRHTDVILHAANTLLFWSVLSALMARLTHVSGGQRTVIAWIFSLLWALHPVNASTYAADMGRTHLLAATFCLISLRFHLASLAQGRGSAAMFAAAVIALLLSMASKPMVGWVLLTAALESLFLGWRPMLRSPRIYIIAVICVFFGWLAFQTSSRAGILEETEIALFGDRVSRSLLAAWIYIRHILLPINLSTWYLPDVRTSWAYAPVWLGAAFLVASLITLFVAAKRSSAGGAALAIIWFWALLLPVLGFVGGRTVAAQDRYLYQPLMGFAFLGAWGCSQWTARNKTRYQALIAGASAVSAACLLWDTVLCLNARSTIRRAVRVVSLNPGDPRATEGLAAAYDFAATNDTPEGRVDPPPDFLALFEQTLDRAIREAQSSPVYFPTSNDMAAFHRRMSRHFMHAGIPEKSLAQAEAAKQIEPDAVLTWLRIAAAQRAMGHYAEARTAYERIESLLGPNSPGRAKRLTEFGILLQTQFNDSVAARDKFLAVIEPLFDISPSTDSNPTQRVAELESRIDLSPAQRDETTARLNSDTAYPIAVVGLAKAEIRVGEGAVGYALIQRIRAVFPTMIDAVVVEGEYHLRSNHWDEAAAVYADVLRSDPAQFDALLGFQEVCAQRGDWESAMLAWNRAVSAPNSRKLICQSFFVWSAACAGDPQAAAWTESLLHSDPDNQLGCLSRVLLETRAGEIETALKWVDRAAQAQPLPQTRAMERAMATLDLMADRKKLLSEADIVRAAIKNALGLHADAISILDAFIATNSESRWIDTAKAIRARMPAK